MAFPWGARALPGAAPATIYRRAHWPTWTPTANMIRRDPALRQYAGGYPPGPSNPLGARALYLMTGGADRGYRIHGTPEWWLIGKYVSSGCIRMINQDVADLYDRVPTGTPRNHALAKLPASQGFCCDRAQSFCRGGAVGVATYAACQTGRWSGMPRPKRVVAHVAAWRDLTSAPCRAWKSGHRHSGEAPVTIA